MFGIYGGRQWIKIRTISCRSIRNVAYHFSQVSWFLSSHPFIWLFMFICPRHGVNPKKLEVGLKIQSAQEITISAATITQWNSFFLPSSRLQTRDPVVAPSVLLVNLAMGMAVDTFSYTCRYHLAVEKCVYVTPVNIGDTIRCLVTILEVSIFYSCFWLVHFFDLAHSDWGREDEFFISKSDVLAPTHLR